MKIVNFSKKNDNTFNIIFDFLKNIKLNEDGKLIDFNNLDIESFILEKNFNELNETLYNFIFEIFKKNSKTSFINNIEDICDSIMEFTSGKMVYVSINLNSIDPAYAPGTFFPEVGGFSSREFIYLIQRINKMKNLFALDLDGINSKKDINKITLQLCAKILAESI